MTATQEATTIMPAEVSSHPTEVFCWLIINNTHPYIMGTYYTPEDAHRHAPTRHPDTTMHLLRIPLAASFFRDPS